MNSRKLHRSVSTSAAAIFLGCLMVVNSSAIESLSGQVGSVYEEIGNLDVSAVERSGNCGNSINWDLNESGIMKLTGSGKLSDSVTSGSDIPWASLSNEIEELSVGDGIQNVGGFAGCANLTKISFGKDVKTISAGAFLDCSSLEAVMLPSSVTSVGDNAFSGCSSLKVLSIPESLASVGKNAFLGCSSLGTVVIPQTVTSIGSYAFGYESASTDGAISHFVINCYSDSEAEKYAKENKIVLTLLDDQKEDVPKGSCGVNAKWEISDSTLKITGSGKITDFSSASAVPWKNYLAENYFSKVSVSGGITSVGNYTFSKLSGVESITLPDSVTRIGISAFSESSFKTITIPSGTTVIEVNAFKNCKSLTSVTFGSKLKSVGESSFEGCTSLETVTIPTSVTSISKKAFSGCSALTSVSLAGSVKSIGEEAFSGCTKLKNINFPNLLETIGNKAFYECKSLASVSIGGSVKKIAGQAFAGCTSLRTVTLGSGIKVIEAYAFSGCSAITSLTIPDSVTALSEGAFYSCSGMTDLRIGTGVTVITLKAFENCSSLKNVSLSEGLYTIKERAFTNCTALKEITVPQSVTMVETHAVGFSCENVNGSKTYLPYSDFIVKGFHPSYAETYAKDNNFIFTSTGTIGEDGGTLANGLKWDIKVTTGVFRISGTGRMFDYLSVDDAPWAAYVSTIKSVIIDRGVTYVGKYSFSGCDILTSVSFPTTLTEIGDYAFNGCVMLDTVELPSSLAKIGAYSFAGCTWLDSLRIPEGLTDIGDYAFNGCDALTAITLPKGISHIGAFALGCSGETVNSNFTVYGYENTAAQSYASEKSVNFVRAGSLVMSDSESGVQISFSDSEDTVSYEFKVLTVKPEVYKDYIIINPSKTMAIYLVSLIKSGEVIAPQNEAEIAVPLPSGMSSIECSVFRVRGNGSFEKVNTMVKEGKLTFKTSELFDIVVTDADLTKVFTAQIQYVYENGAQAADPVTVYCSTGAEFELGSPSVDGFTPNEENPKITVSNEDVVYTVTYAKSAASSGDGNDSQSGDASSGKNSKYVLLLIIEITVMAMTLIAAGLIIWIYIKKHKNAAALKAANGQENDSEAARTIVMDSTTAASVHGIMTENADHDVSYDDDLAFDDSQFENEDSGYTDSGYDDKADSYGDETGYSDDSETGYADDAGYEDEDGDMKIAGGENDMDGDMKIAGSADDDVKIFGGTDASGDENGKTDTSALDSDTIIIDLSGSHGKQ